MSPKVRLANSIVMLSERRKTLPLVWETCSKHYHTEANVRSIPVWHFTRRDGLAQLDLGRSIAPEASGRVGVMGFSLLRRGSAGWLVRDPREPCFAGAERPGYLIAWKVGF